ncbi:MAG: dinitrogenase iron-molybdenum cofactor biosynthesis protein [Proteobacteria bacterium]|nr:dinitrogenase iron-molybdenum cofactor biosynthesis protein [Pseudomonadota bacterium]MBU1639602.1 dinitrogenase iron-molybdenum cofactor biosynthesis protein [Pseudomonadota bacterium]
MTLIPLPDKKTGCGCNNPPEWISLPVAPNPAARSRFSGDEKLPQAVPLYGALTWIDDLQARGTSIAGLDIRGPGDPLASMPMTLEILHVLQEKHPKFAFAITTLGLGLADNAELLKEHGVSKVTLLLDAVHPEVIKKLYAWIRPGKRNMQIATAAATLIEEQTKGIAACRTAGMEVVVHTSVYSNVNEGEVAEIALLASDLGAESMTLLPGKGWSEGEEKLPLPLPTSEIMARLSASAAKHIKIVEPLHGESLDDITSEKSCGTIALPKATAARPNVAVLSSNGMDIDLHLGQAIKALIYGPRVDGLTCLLEARDLPEPGGGEGRWQQVAEILDDCFVLLAESAGQKPRQILGTTGLPIILIDDNVEGTVDVLYGGGKKGKCKKG